MTDLASAECFRQTKQVLERASQITKFSDCQRHGQFPCFKRSFLVDSIVSVAII